MRGIKIPSVVAGVALFDATISKVAFGLVVPIPTCAVRWALNNITDK